jgi:hypothetical protein
LLTDYSQHNPCRKTKKPPFVEKTAVFDGKLIFPGQRPKTVRAGIMESTIGGVIIIMEPSVGRTYIGRAYIKPGVMDMECIGRPRCVWV